MAEPEPVEACREPVEKRPTAKPCLYGRSLRATDCLLGRPLHWRGIPHLEARPVGPDVPCVWPPQNELPSRVGTSPLEGLTRLAGGWQRPLQTGPLPLGDIRAFAIRGRALSTDGRALASCVHALPMNGRALASYVHAPATNGRALASYVRALPMNGHALADYVRALARARI